VFSLSYTAYARDFVSLRILYIVDPQPIIANYVRFASVRQELITYNIILFRDMCLPILSKLTYTIYARD
jgi:hypothetical protein